MVRTASSALVRRGALVALALTTSALAVGVVTSPAGAARASATSKWIFHPSPAVNDFTLKWVACSGKGCVAMAEVCSPGGCGGLLTGKALSSANDGVSWKAGSYPATQGDPKGIACASPSFCVSSGVNGPISHALDTIDVTKNAGASWSVHVEAAWSTGVAACPTTKVCFAFASPATGSFFTTEVLRSTNSGATWSHYGYTSVKGYIYATACSSTTQCVAMGSSEVGTPFVFLTTNAGASWKQVSMPTTATDFSSLSCNGAVCFAVGNSVLAVSRNGGKSWSVHPVPSNGPQIRGGSCLTATVCLLVGYDSGTPLSPAAEITHNGGASWAQETLPHADGWLNAIQCTSSTSCVAVGGRETYSGSTATAEYPLVFTY